MSIVRVNCFSISIDGYGAGPDQSLEQPLGIGGSDLPQWFYPTRTFQSMFGKDGTTGVDNDLAERGMNNLGAWIIGRNMFTPFRGPWENHDWKGWWGDDPPYHTPVFVVTNHPREPLEMEGGTIFHFVTDGIDAALERARAAAGDRDIRIGGGTSVIRQYLQAGHIDQVHLAVSPIFLGSGENLLAGIDFPALGFERAEHITTPQAMHIVLNRGNRATF
jgi:dihydrofolate reductase